MADIVVVMDFATSRLDAILEIQRREGKVGVPNEINVVSRHNELGWIFSHELQHHFVACHGFSKEFGVVVFRPAHMPKKRRLVLCTRADPLDQVVVDSRTLRYFVVT